MAKGLILTPGTEDRTRWGLPRRWLAPEWAPPSAVRGLLWGEDAGCACVGMGGTLPPCDGEISWPKSPAIPARIDNAARGCGELSTDTLPRLSGVELLGRQRKPAGNMAGDR